MADAKPHLTIRIALLLLIMAVVYASLLLLKTSHEPLWQDLLTTLVGVAIVALSANRLFAHVWIRRPVTLRVGLLVLTNLVIYGLVSIDAPYWIYVLIIAGILIYASVSPRLRYWPGSAPEKRSISQR